MRSVKETLKEFLFPPRCAVCGSLLPLEKEERLLCPNAVSAADLWTMTFFAIGAAIRIFFLQRAQRHFPMKPCRRRLPLLSFMGIAMKGSGSVI